MGVTKFDINMLSFWKWGEGSTGCLRRGELVQVKMELVVIIRVRQGP